MSIAIILVAMWSVLPLYAQQDIPIGEWRTYASFNASRDITQSDDYIYSASPNGLVRLAKTDHSITTISKVDGLSDSDLIHVAYDSVTQQLIILYENGNIDILDDQTTYNLPEVLLNTDIQAPKSANQLRLDGRGTAYICYDFGLVQLDLASRTFGFTLRTSEEVMDFALFEDRFYIATSEGLYQNDASSTVNHADIGTWSLTYPDLDGQAAQAVAPYGDQLLAGLGGDLYVVTDGTPTLWLAAADGYQVRTIAPMPSVVATSFEWIGDGFIIDQVYLFDEQGTVLQAYLREFCSIIMHDMIETGTGRRYWANRQDIKFSDAIGEGCQEIRAGGPPTSDAFEVAFDGQEVIVASGEVSDRNAASFNTNGIYTYVDGSWDQFNHQDAPFGDTVLTYLDVDIGAQGQMAIGTFFDGIVTISPDGSEILQYNRFNSCIDGQEFLPDVQSIYDVKYDDRGRLWLTNFRAREPLKVIDTDGNCIRLPRSRFVGTTELSELAIDDRGVLWVAGTDASVGVVAYDPGDLSDPNDDQFRSLNTSNSALTDNITWDVARDLDGDIWVGTDRGVIVFDCPGLIFDGGCFGRQPIVVVDGVPARLLENERVRTIAVDGANRKWFGTNNGIFVQSANGEEEVLRFDITNSPLPSNFIRDISINPISGEVFIATDKGLISYRSDATVGGDIHAPESEVYAFPNPVRPNYDGPIAVRGLPSNARVKITDIQGKLMFDGRANGGQAIWDGRDYTGRKAASGVYLVFSTSETDDFNTTKPDALVSKILIVR